MNRGKASRLVGAVVVMSLVTMVPAVAAAGAPAKTHDGREIDLAELHATKPVVMFFFASWCHMCAAQLEPFARLAESAAAAEVAVVGVSIQEKAQTVASFVEKHSVQYPVLVDHDGEVARRYGVEGIPTIIAISAGGERVFTGHEVPENPGELLARLRDE